MKIFAGIGAIIFVVVLTLSLTIDVLVKNSIEDSTSELLNTEVKISDVDISIFKGTSEIHGFAILNPEGFSDEVAISFQEMTMSINLMSLLSDTIVIEEFIIKSPKIYLEQKGTRANLNDLNNSLQKSSPSSDESGKRIVIDYFRMEEGQIRISSELEKEREAAATISKIELKDIGKNGSNTIKETIQQVLEPILREAITNTIKNSVMDKVENAVKDLIDN